MLTVVKLSEDAGFHVCVDRLSTGNAASCCTVTVRIGAPSALTLIIPVLEVFPVLGWTDIANEPLPVRFAGVMPCTLSHL